MAAPGNSSASVVVTRFAPSPSGHLHVGGARTALFNWAYAKGRGGPGSRFVLRIEDTDTKRSSDTASMAFLEDLAWLGIDWDEGPEFEQIHRSASPQVHSRHTLGGGENGPYFQSQRLDIYNRYIEQLIAEGKAYRAYETPEELEAAREQARAEGRNYRYQRPPHAADSPDQPHVVRFAVPEGREIVVRDQVLGEVRTPAAPEPGSLDDFVIRKRDGYPTYHFAVVVDDELMGVTHVIRAQEHLSNTPRHMLLQEALGFRTPVYAHISVVTNPNGSKMSKRDKDKALRAAVREHALTAPPHVAGGDGLALREEEWAWWIEADDRQLNPEAEQVLAEALGVQLPEINVDDFRRAGYLPEVMVNYLALLGWNPGGDVEKFDRAFLIEKFDFDRIIKSPAKFDREKLLAFNLDAIQALSPEEFVARLREHAERYHPEFLERLGERFDAFGRANQPRSKTLDDSFRTDRFFIVGDEQIVIEDSKPVRKALGGGPPSGADHLEAILPVLRELKEWTVDSLETAISNYAAQHAEGKLGKVAQPLRIAVTGGVVSPAIFDTLAILGKQSTLARIGQCLVQHREHREVRIATADKRG